ncbi:MAG: hypothetical protein SFX18_03730 [Pirellulales bacterium]|nr:hypothetical protein [Pirellulales bacterium]
MKKFSLYALLCGLFWACGFPAAAADKPVAVITLAGIDAIMSDVDYIGTVTNNPVVKGEKLEGVLLLPTNGIGLNAFDKSKPWGVAVFAADGEYYGIGMLPIKSLDDLMTATKNFVQGPTDEGNGVQSVQLQNGATLMIKEVTGYLFISDKAEHLADLPADPVALLGTLPKEYDFGMRGFMQNVPEKDREEIVSQLKIGMDQSLQQREGEDDNAFELRKKYVEKMSADFEQAVNELETITIGLNIDSAKRAAYLDFAATAKPGSKSAQQAATLVNVTSLFTGFINPDAGITGNMSSQLSSEDIETASMLIKSGSEALKKELEKDGELSEDKLAMAKEIVNELVEVAIKTVQGGQLDTAGNVAMGEKSLSVALAGLVADGTAVENVVKKVVDFAKEDITDVKLNSETYKDVRFHSLGIPLPEPELQDVFGENMPIVVGIGPKAVYLGVGKDGAKLIKEGLDASAAAGPKPVDPVAINSALTPVVTFAHSMKPDPMGEVLKETLSNSSGKDHVQFYIKAIPNGSQGRFQIDEGVIQLIGVGASQAADLAPGL